MPVESREVKPVERPTEWDPYISIVRKDTTVHLPIRGTPGSAGLDVFAYILDGLGRPSKIMVPSRSVRSIPTGLMIKPPDGFVTMVCTRSGMAKERGIFVANAPGIVDPDYTGDLLILLYNGGFEPYWVQHEQRVAQLVTVPLPTVRILEVAALPDTQRGTKGFGSTGA